MKKSINIFLTIFLILIIGVFMHPPATQRILIKAPQTSPDFAEFLFIIDESFNLKYFILAPV